METKTCSKCKEVISLDLFNFKNKARGEKYSCCKTCWNAINKQRYADNKQYYIDKAKSRTEAIRSWLKDLKSELICARCGEDHWSCLELHHEDQLEKEFQISDAAHRGYSKKRIMEEIKKCEVLCANCHRKHHHP